MLLLLRSALTWPSPPPPQLVVAMPAYLQALASSSGVVPEFVNPKYADAARETFKSPTRLECMMQASPY